MEGQSPPNAVLWRASAPAEADSASAGAFPVRGGIREHWFTSLAYHREPRGPDFLNHSSCS